jgi:hypothetical protein
MKTFINPFVASHVVNSISHNNVFDSKIKAKQRKFFGSFVKKIIKQEVEKENETEGNDLQHIK